MWEYGTVQCVIAAVQYTIAAEWTWDYGAVQHATAFISSVVRNSVSALQQRAARASAFTTLRRTVLGC